MILEWGSFRFSNAAVETVIDRQPLLDAAQNIWAYDEVWRLRCFLDNPTASPTTMATLLRNMEAAFATGGKNLRLLLESGGPSHHQLLTANTVGGTRVTKPPSYPEGRGYQYGTYRTVDIEITATVPVNPNTRSPYTAFSESFSYQGGGPRFGFLEPLTGFPIKQRLKQNTLWRARQQGTAVGLSWWPEAPSPLFPADLLEFVNPVERGHPQRIGSSLVNFPISWSYEFASAIPKAGRPNLWTR